MTCNQYFFRHRNTNFVIYAKDIPDAFIPWKRFFGKFQADQSEFEKNLIDPVNISDCCILTGNSLSVDEIRNLVFKHKPAAITLLYNKKEREYTAAPKEIAKVLSESVPVSEEQALGDEFKNLPILKRGRGRPKGSKNKSKTDENINQYFIS